MSAPAIGVQGGLWQRNKQMAARLAQGAQPLLGVFSGYDPSANVFGNTDQGADFVTITAAGSSFAREAPCRLIRVVANGEGIVSVLDGPGGHVVASLAFTEAEGTVGIEPRGYCWLGGGCYVVFSGTGEVGVFLG